MLQTVAKMTVALRLEPRQGRHHAFDRPEEIGLHRVLMLFHRQIAGKTSVHDGGIVDEHVEAAMVLPDLVENGLPLHRGADVELDRRCGGTDAFRDGSCTRQVDVGEDDRVAGIGREPGKAAPMPLAAPVMRKILETGAFIFTLCLLLRQAGCFWLFHPKSGYLIVFRRSGRKTASHFSWNCFRNRCGSNW